MKENFLISVLFYFSLFSFGQNNEDSNFRTLTGNANVNTDGMWIPARKSNEVFGSIYLFPSWDGYYKIKLKNRSSFKLTNLNYCLLTSTLESKISRDSVFQFRSEELESFNDGKRFYVFLNEVLYQKLYESVKFNFYKKILLHKKDAVFNPLTQTNISEEKYTMKEIYFIAKENNLEQVKLNKKSLLNLLEDKKNEINEFIKVRNLSCSEENDFIQILTYYNSI